MASLTIEGHPLATRTGLWCARCESASVTSVTCAIVDAATLEILSRYEGSRCASCDAETFHRLAVTHPA